jgi:hypothetical protein
VERSTGIRPISAHFSSIKSTGRNSPAVPPACAVMLSSISVPEKSLHPVRYVIAA